MWKSDPTKVGIAGGDSFRRTAIADLTKAGMLSKWHVLIDPDSGASVKVMLDFKGAEIFELTAKFGEIGNGIERSTVAELTQAGRVFGIFTPRHASGVTCGEHQ